MVFPVFWRGTTPPIRDDNGKILSNSIASLERVHIGGMPQWILIRGAHIANPVILFLHGGPGMPAMYLAHRFQRPLEKDFTVIQWDRRGAGKTFRKDTPPESIRVTQEIADAVSLVKLMGSRLEHSKVFLVGHSYGTYLGMILANRFPELFHAYIGIGQLAYSEERNRELQREWIQLQAKSSGDARLLRDLDAEAPIDYEEYLFKFGGALHNGRSFTPLLMAGLRAPEYSLKDVLNVRRGVVFTHKNMKYDAIKGDLIDEIRNLNIPVFFFTGRYDYVDPFQFTVEYANKLLAPKKETVWFENSAHFPFFEEPEKFAGEMKRVARESQN